MKRKYVYLIILSLILCGFASCKTKPESDYIIIHIDKSKLPARIFCGEAGDKVIIVDRDGKVWAE